jgi:PKD repeat protein
MLKLFVFLGLILPLSIQQSVGQCDTTHATYASDFDAFGGTPDTLCVGECQRYWITNKCILTEGYIYYWLFTGTSNTDMIIGDTVSVCFIDTGKKFMYLKYYSGYQMSSTGFSLNIILPCPPTALFSASKKQICSNECVQYTDQSQRLPIEWEWTFEGGTPAYFYGQKPPPVCYTDTGRFAVKLTVRSKFGEDSITETNYIEVAPAPSQ